MVTASEGDLAKAPLDLPHDITKGLAGGDIAGDVDAAGGAFTFDRIRRGYDGEVGHIGEAHMAACRCFNQKLTKRGVVGAYTGHAPDGDIMDALLLIDFADFSPANERGDGLADLSGGEAVQRGVKVLTELRKPLLDETARRNLFGDQQYARRS